VDPAVSPAAVARFCLALALGSALLAPDPGDVDDEDWGALLARLVTSLEPQTEHEETGALR
jgi:TetR/AcrR family transcriptional repressor of nem operon